MSDTNQHIDAKTFAIGVLSITACILFVGLILIMTQPSPAYAIGQNDRGGDYIMLTQQLSNSQEGCVIIDAASRQLNMYALNGSNKQLQIINANVSLDQLPNATSDRRSNP